MKIKTATLTFHASHNYGSMLQAYALQHVIKSLGFDNTIINLRTNGQKFMYRHPDDVRNASWKSKYIGRLLKIPFRKNLIKKYFLFEGFIAQDLDITEELSSLEDVTDFVRENKFDLYVAGSDQIWNTSCRDFDWSYFLPFAEKNALSYACSMGPSGQIQVKGNTYEHIRNYLLNFRAISVREKGTAQVIDRITGHCPEVHIDPTLLLSSKEWESDKHFIEAPIVKGDYMFVYTPFYNADVYDIASRISKIKKIPVVCSMFHYKAFLKHTKIKRLLPVGPWEFLNLIKHAKMIVSGSFHAIAFAIIFKRPFFAVNGDYDNRMCSILSLLSLENHTIHINDIEDKIKHINYIDWSKVEPVLDILKAQSLSYLNRNLKADD